MNRLLLLFTVLLVLAGCGETLALKNSDTSSNSSVVDRDDYTFTLYVNDVKDNNESLVKAELSYDGNEESVDIQHAGEIFSLQLLDEENAVVFYTAPTDNADLTTLTKEQDVLADLSVNLSDLPSPGQYTVVVVADFADIATDKSYDIENSISFEVE